MYNYVAKIGDQTGENKHISLTKNVFLIINVKVKKNWRLNIKPTFTI